MTCADVQYREGPHRPWYESGIGDELWNPKAGEGHVLVREEPCGGRYDCGCGGWAGPCSSTTLVCECGQDNAWRDHHYWLLPRG